ncbi:hypothetical protein EMIHUDRAFT_217240 [Emiliania huxleyi CCMP1516]|uniref:Uncharacterized protein n=2 Tax=Emiliania huxleyi TaxID=2903 RepID=A0A0D3IBA9_EMIH1|nr:hypothetical protein EMIHUDRAFT_217240 [Emiliania huxleyi CCMP1516]EOD08544.1 hypothetical protein EMIHUDRAFT_217240 [Emiliania huxleyi CCMP1516]|eukprot:XP_005760973.1 hypothetical protein EMIHUDRAFT_217240 [Emiliania huxleyi CCMP1516]
MGALVRRRLGLAVTRAAAFGLRRAVNRPVGAGSLARSGSGGIGTEASRHCSEHNLEQRGAVGNAPAEHEPGSRWPQAAYLGQHSSQAGMSA